MVIRKHEKVFAILSYIEHFLILYSTITGYVSISDTFFLWLVFQYKLRSAAGLKICATTAGIKKYKSIIKQKHKSMLAKSKLNSTELLISKAWITSVISHDELVLINNVLKEYDNMKEKNKNLKT